ncbi:MAG TPA: NYN domain-containing protein [Actinomycetales bacterium]|nr:NYN domain-containing protein [Actinomycetales bacterium]
MTTHERDQDERTVRCAMFVDFDNVYLGLRRLDPEAAEAFATEPAHWLAQLQSATGPDGPFTRRFLVRACYLNPSAFSRFRPNFTRAGFQVVDCPSLTQQGKSSADINLVLDAVDALAAPTRYDEFVIVSADADFTPLALRCRAADRRVTIITASPAASAYRAVADVVVTADELAELVTVGPGPASVPDQADESATGRTAPSEATDVPASEAVSRALREADGPLPGGKVAQIAQAADPSLPASGWGGTGGFFAWLEAHVPDAGTASRPAPGYVWDAKRYGEKDLPSSGSASDPAVLRRQVVTVTDTPGLTGEQFRLVLTTLAKDVDSVPFDRADTSRRVRDACQENGANVGRGSVNFVISGILYSGVELQAGTPVEVYAEALAGNVIGLCRGARMDLSPGDVQAIREWVGGGLLDT